MEINLKTHTTLTNHRFPHFSPRAAANNPHQLPSRHRYLPFPPLSRPRAPNLLPSSPSSISRAFSLPDDEFHSSGATVLNEDPSFAIKKKAAEIDLKGTSIYLVGMNNAMKTSVGKLLAEALRYYYFDSDGLIEEAAGGKMAVKSFRESDKKAYDDSETEVLKQLSALGRLVVCAGDGAVQSSTNLALLRHGLSIWIDVPLDLVAKEIVNDGNEYPGSDISTMGSYSEAVSQLAIIYQEMSSGYATADAKISLPKVANQLGHDDLNSVTAKDLVLEVLVEIEKLTRVKRMMEAAARPF